MNFGCKCGAYDASPDGYRQMTPAERAQFMANAQACKTCARDRREQRP